MSNKAYAVVSGFTTTPALLTDSFGGASLDATVWNVVTDGPAGATLTVSESSGALHMGISSPGGGPACQSCAQTVAPVDLTGSCMRVRLADTSGTLTSTGGMFTGLTATTGIPGATSLQLPLEAGALYAQYALSGSTARVGSVGFSSATQWVQIREAGGTLYWETSPDGIAWTAFGTLPTSAFTAGITSLYPILTGYYYSSAPVSGLAFAYADFAFGPPAPAAVASAEVVDASGAVVLAPGSGLPPGIIAPFGAGHSDQVVFDAVVEAVQNAAGDATLEVSVLGS